MAGFRAHQYFVKSKASYGWSGRDPTKKDANSLFSILSRSLGTNRAASKHLRRVWYGATTDLALATVTHRWCRIKRLRDMLEWKRRPNTSLQRLRKNLQDLDFTEVGPWHWKARCNQVPKVDQVLDLRKTDSQDTDHQKHVLREAYRRHHFRQWTREDRRDSRELRAHHSEEQLFHCYIQSNAKDIRYLLHIPQLRSLILGSFVSPAAFAAAHQKDVSVDGLCPFCTTSIGTLDHILWECDHNRPPAVPTTPLERRLGWCHQPYYHNHLIQTVQSIWDFRFKT